MDIDNYESTLSCDHASFVRLPHTSNFQTNSEVKRRARVTQGWVENQMGAA